MLIDRLSRKTRAALVATTALAGFALASVAADAQTLVQQSPTRLDAATVVGTSKTSAATITITPTNGLSFYLTGVDIMNCAGASAVTAAAPTDITTTNLGGVTWTVGSGVTAGLCQTENMAYVTPIKSAAPGTAVTVVLPTFATNQVVRASVYGYYAP